MSIITLSEKEKKKVRVEKTNKKKREKNGKKTRVVSFTLILIFRSRAFLFPFFSSFSLPQLDIDTLFLRIRSLCSLFFKAELFFPTSRSPVNVISKKRKKKDDKLKTFKFITSFLILPKYILENEFSRRKKNVGKKNYPSRIPRNMEKVFTR